MTKYERVIRVQDNNTGQFTDYRLDDVTVTLYVLSTMPSGTSGPSSMMLRVCEVLKPNQT